MKIYTSSVCDMVTGVSRYIGGAVWGQVSHRIAATSVLILILLEERDEDA